MSRAWMKEKTDWFSRNYLLALTGCGCQGEGAKKSRGKPGFWVARLAAQFGVVPSTCTSSPDSYISIMMSEPPTNSPFTYNCGMVGQLL